MKITAATANASTIAHKTTRSTILSAFRFNAQVLQPRPLGSIMVPQSRQGIWVMAQLGRYGVFGWLKPLCNNTLDLSFKAPAMFVSRDGCENKVGTLRRR